MDIIWTIIIGLAAGIVAKFVLLGSRTEPSDFVTTAILGNFSEQWLPPSSVGRWAGMNQAKERALSVP